MTPELAIAAGAQFLRRSARHGRWSAFHLYPGISDEWVTAYVGATLAEVGLDEFAALAAGGLAGRQRPDGRFGFNARAIGDADSTLWALRLAAATGTDPFDRAGAAAVLPAHVRAGGGVATYSADEPIRTIIEAPPDRVMAGWCAPHPCVTAVAAAVTETRPAALAHLLATQRPDGSWGAYWWPDPEYTVAHAAEALDGYGGPAGRVAASRAAGWVVGRLAGQGAVRTSAYPDGSPFATALALRASLAGVAGAHPNVTAAVEWLCRQVRLDGSWTPSAVLRVPDPADTDPDWSGMTVWMPGTRKEGAVVVDRTAVFTTATVIAALARVSP